ncbi:MAG: HEAT repeat domain-containing protein [Planctomycetota bacterium]
MTPEELNRKRRAALAAVNLPDRVHLIGQAMRFADPDEAEVLAIELIEATHRLRDDPPTWVNHVTRGWASTLVPRDWRASIEKRWGKPAVRRAALCLAGRWTELTEPTRRLAAAAFDRQWRAALFDMATHPQHSVDVRQLAGLAAAASSTPTPTDPVVFSDLLEHLSPDIIESASAALGRMIAARVVSLGEGLGNARQHADLIDEITSGHGPCNAPPPDERLATALNDAIRTVGDHRRRELLTGAVLFAVSDSPEAGVVAEWLRPHTDSDDGAREFATAFKRSKAPVVRAAAWRWLDGFGADAVMLERLGNANGRHDHDALLDAWHLVFRPERASRARPLLASRAASEKALPDHSDLALMRDRQRLGLVHLVDGLRAPDDVRSTRLVARLNDPSPIVRLASARAATHSDLADWCFDASEPVARSATLRWTRPTTTAAAPSDDSRRRLARTLAKSPHRSVRSIAVDALASLESWAQVTPSTALRLRAWHLAEPEAAVTGIRERLRSPSAASRITTIRLADRAGLSFAIESDLIASTRLSSSDLADSERVAATAVRALRRVSTKTARRAVRTALEAEDARVRANAVESLSISEASDPSAYASLVELKDDGAHRTRANALRALLSPPGAMSSGRLFEPEGVESLERMLGDDRREHRLAAMWLAERTLCGGGASRLGPSFDPLARRVASIARDDDDAAVRARGIRCASRLLGEIRADRADLEGVPA